MKPLEGITVVSVEQAVAAPFATRHLADLGARVIKVERPDGGDFARYYDTTVKGLSSYFVWCNRGKESLTLNLKDEQGRRVLHKLAETADVFVQNLAPGAAARLGFGAEELRATNPTQVVCEITGFGTTGPYRDRKAYDLIVQAETGVISVTGSESTPAKAGISIADIATGMYAFSGILAALYRRTFTGQGSLVSVSMLDALGEWVSQPAYFERYGGRPMTRSGADHSTIAPYGPFTCGDGEVVFIGVQNEREWEALCREVLARPEIAHDPRFIGNENRVRNRQALSRILAEAFRSASAEEVSRRLDGARIVNGQVRAPGDLWEHPQIRARQRIAQVDTPGGPVDTFLPPLWASASETDLGAVPSLGEHTARLLEELGYNGEESAALRARGAI